MTPGSEDDPRLRFRIWVGGKLTGDEWVDTSSPGARQQVRDIQARHLAETWHAERSGQGWLVEVHDPAEPEDRAYLRFGTDRDGMIMPQPAGPPGPGWPFET